MRPSGLGSITDSNCFHGWALLKLYQGIMYEMPRWEQKRKEDERKKEISLQLRRWLSDDISFFRCKCGTSAALTPLARELARRQVVDEQLTKYHIP